MKCLSVPLILLTLLFSLPSCDKIAESRANSHYEDGTTKHSSGDLEGAIADYSRALAINDDHLGARKNRCRALVGRGEFELALEDINRVVKLRPKNAEAHTMRASILNKLGHIEAATADANRAVALAPDSAAGYMMRGSLKSYEGDPAAGLADLDRAVSLEPQSAMVHASRGALRQAAGDIDGALADIDKALELDPAFVPAYRQRGTAMIIRQDWTRALENLQEGLRLSPANSDVDYIQIFLWITRSRMGDAKAANDGLADHWANRTHGGDEWPNHVAGFLLGTIAEAELLAKAASPDANTNRNQKCEAWYYAGLKRQLAGNANGAKEAYQNCIATGQTAFYEYAFARSELERMGR